MRKRLFFWFFFALAGSAVLGITGFFVLPVKGEISVLMYHYVVPPKQVGSTSLDVSVESFEQQMRLLRNLNFRPISLDTYDDILKGRQKPKGKEVVITFDDGNRSYFEYALPILRKYQIPSVNFLIDNELENGMIAMTIDQVKALAEDPLITFGSHTLSHPNLKESPSERVQEELAESKLNLEQKTGRPVYYFSYPYGVFSDYARKAVENAGYRLAFTTSYKKLEGRKVTDFSIPRIKICPGDNLFVFWLKVSGLATYGEQFKVWFRPYRERFFGKRTKPVEPVDLYREAA